MEKPTKVTSIQIHCERQVVPGTELELDEQVQSNRRASHSAHVVCYYRHQLARK